MTKHRIGLSISLLVIAGLGVACQGDSSMNVTAAEGTPVALAQLAPSSWIAVELGGQPTLATDGGRRRPSLVFQSETSVIGSSGCNDFKAPASGESQSVRFGPFASTRKACSEPIMEQERRYLTALGEGGRLERGMNLLFLIGNDGQPSVRFEAAMENPEFDD